MYNLYLVLFLLLLPLFSFLPLFMYVVKNISFIICLQYIRAIISKKENFIKRIQDRKIGMIKDV